MFCGMTGLGDHLRIRFPDDVDGLSPNAGLFWHKLLEEVPEVTTPDTEFVGMWMSDDLHGPNDFGVRWDTDAVEQAVERVGGFPAFVRTEFTSSKHDFKDASVIASPDEIDETIHQLIQEPVQRMIPVGCLMIREYLDLDSYFTAFRGELPIGPEIRFFIDDEVVCSHPYWEPDAIKDPSSREWRGRLKAANDVVREEASDVAPKAERVAELLTSEYPDAPPMSVDFARTNDGEWYAIDMAHAGTTHHPGDCKHEEEFPDPRR